MSNATLRSEPIPEWVAQEIRDTWNLARNAGSELGAFRVFERMTDRLGYGRTQNPPLKKEDI